MPVGFGRKERICMGAAATMTVETLTGELATAAKNIAFPRSTDPWQLYTLAASLERVAEAIETRWEQLPTDVRTMALYRIYDAIEGSRDPRTQIGVLSWRMKALWCAISGDSDAVFAFQAAAVRLRNAVLSAVENESEQYAEDLEEICSGFPFDVHAGTPLDRDTALEHFRRISSQDS
jgi:hypothetical protein